MLYDSLTYAGNGTTDSTTDSISLLFLHRNSWGFLAHDDLVTRVIDDPKLWSWISDWLVSIVTKDQQTIPKQTQIKTKKCSLCRRREKITECCLGKAAFYMHFFESLFKQTMFCPLMHVFFMKSPRYLDFMSYFTSDIIYKRLQLHVVF